VVMWVWSIEYKIGSKHHSPLKDTKTFGRNYGEEIYRINLRHIVSKRKKGIKPIESYQNDKVTLKTPLGKTGIICTLANSIDCKWLKHTKYKSIIPYNI
jgi:ribosome maturation factor RimP